MQTHDLAGFDLVVLLLAGFLAPQALVVWGGATLAAVTSGGGLLGVWPLDALAATLRLPTHLGDPAAAWPKPVAEQLPGALHYWTATLFVAALAAAGVLLVLRCYARRPTVGSVRREPLGVDGRAGFATRRDLTPLIVDAPEAGRFTLGHAHGRLLATEPPGGTDTAREAGRAGDRGAVALVGPSRSGKTTAAVSAILEWDGPAVLSSVKSDLLEATHGWRSRHGSVAVFDPTQSTGRHSSAWSPLRDAGTALGAQRAARALCDAAPRAGVQGGMDFWLAQAEILLSALLYVAHHTGADMSGLCQWVMNQDRPGDHGQGNVKPLLDALLNPDNSDEDDASGDAIVASQALFSIWGMEERARSNVYATAQTVVWPWTEPGVAQAARGRSIDLNWLLTTTSDRWANTLYLSAPIEDQQRLAPAFGGLLNDLIKQAYLRVAATGRPLDPPLLVVVDEAGNTPLRAMPEYASTLAGIGVLLVTIWQSVAQIEATYQHHADTILTNHLTKLFYAGLSDPASLRYLATVLGDTEIESRSRTLTPHGIRTSEQANTTRLPLAPAHALRQMRPGDALLLHGTLPPAHLRTRPYHRDPGLAARAHLEPVVEPLTVTDR